MIPDEALLNIIKKVLATDNHNIHLIKELPDADDVDMTRALLEASGVEADYPGYAYQNAGFSTSPTIVSPDDGLTVGEEKTFQPSGMSTPQTIYGYWVTLPVGTDMNELFVFRRFETPLVLLNDDSQIKITVNLYDKDFSPP